MTNCYCGNDQSYEECCLKVHNDQKEATTAQMLMRARYSAFATQKIDFVDRTNTPETTDFDIEDAKKWANTSQWQGLEVLQTHKGQESDSEGLVEFKAKYKDLDNKDQVHHEIGKFKKINDLWYYIEGKILGAMTYKREGPKVGRNDPCTCGSGKKYKKCCA